VLFLAALLVVVPSSLGLVRYVTLCPLMIFIIKILFFSVVVSFFVVRVLLSMIWIISEVSGFFGDVL
jgi:hypothetical protein